MDKPPSPPPRAAPEAPDPDAAGNTAKRGGRKGRSASNPSKGKSAASKQVSRETSDNSRKESNSSFSTEQLTQIGELISVSLEKYDVQKSKGKRKRRRLSTSSSSSESATSVRHPRADWDRQRSDHRHERKANRNKRDRFLSPDVRRGRGHASSSAPSDSSSDDGESQDRAKVQDKKKQIPPPTAYWAGRADEPAGVGKIGGSREKFEDQRHDARRQVEDMEKRYHQKIPAVRWARSHLLLGFQLREVKRLLDHFRGTWVCEVELKHPENHNRELKATWKHVHGALDLAIEATRHELAMADLWDAHGPEMVDAMEGRAPRDPKYAARAELLMKELRKSKVDQAIISGKAMTGPATSRETGHTRAHKSRSYARNKVGGLTGRHPPSNTTKASLADSPLKCFSCGSVKHIMKDCPRKSKKV